MSMSMEDLLKSILGGAQAQPGGQMQQSGGQSSGDPLADLLGSILGGATQGGQQQGQGGLDLGGLLESILGGGAQPSEPTPTQPSQGGEGLAGLGGLGDLLKGILGGAMGGGSTSEAGLGSALAPLVNTLAEKLGLPPQIAQMVVTFVLGKLLSGFAGQQGGGMIPAPQAVPRGYQAPQPQQTQGLNLDDLLQRMGSPRGVEASYIQATGMAEELAGYTGLDPAMATQSLVQAFNLMGGQMGAQGQQPERPTSSARRSGRSARPAAQPKRGGGRGQQKPSSK
jgi:hypothetical protein